jgi:transposase
MDTIIQPVTQQPKRGTYRRHTDEFKRAVVAQSLRPGASLSRVAREHNINANQVFAWRKLFSETQAAAATCAFLPVALARTSSSAPPSSLESKREPSGSIELTIGNASLRLQGAVDMETLALLLQRLLP